MKSLIYLSIASILIFSTSCFKCTQCSIKDGSETVSTYTEFCGSTNENKAFQKDVEYDAGLLQCISCTLYAIDHVTILKEYKNVYGFKDELDKFVKDVAARAAQEHGYYSCTERRTGFGSAECTTVAR